VWETEDSQQAGSKPDGIRTTLNHSVVPSGRSISSSLGPQAIANGVWHRRSAFACARSEAFVIKGLDLGLIRAGFQRRQLGWLSCSRPAHA